MGGLNHILSANVVYCSPQARTLHSCLWHINLLNMFRKLAFVLDVIWNWSPAYVVLRAFKTSFVCSVNKPTGLFLGVDWRCAMKKGFNGKRKPIWNYLQRAMCIFLDFACEMHISKCVMRCQMLPLSLVLLQHLRLNWSTYLFPAGKAFQTRKTKWSSTVWWVFFLNVISIFSKAMDEYYINMYLILMSWSCRLLNQKAATQLATAWL